MGRSRWFPASRASENRASPPRYRSDFVSSRARNCAIPAPHSIMIAHYIRLSFNSSMPLGKREDILETRLDKLEILVAQTGKLSAEMTGLIADLLGLAGMGRYPAAPPDPQRRRELILAGLIRQLEARARATGASDF